MLIRSRNNKIILDMNKKYIAMGVIYSGNGGSFDGCGVICSGTEDFRSQYFEKIENLEVVDSTVPDYWKVGYNGKDLILSFPEMVDDLGSLGNPGFYERYLEGDAECLAIMERYYMMEESRL